MAKHLIALSTIVFLLVCIINGGCWSPKPETIKQWKDYINIADENDSQSEEKELGQSSNDEEIIKEGEKIDIELYFTKANGAGLVMERRTIEKTEGIARRTLEELFNGPNNPEHSAIFPEGTRLLDINVKPEGHCIVDLSSEVRLVNSEEEERLMVYSLVNTLGQFPTIKEVTFMIEGEKVNQIGGFYDLSKPVEPDYSI